MRTDRKKKKRLVIQYLGQDYSYFHLFLSIPDSFTWPMKYFNCDKCTSADNVDQVL